MWGESVPVGGPEVQQADRVAQAGAGDLSTLALHPGGDGSAGAVAESVAGEDKVSRGGVGAKAIVGGSTVDSVVIVKRHRDGETQFSEDATDLLLHPVVALLGHAGLGVDGAGVAVELPQPA